MSRITRSASKKPSQREDATMLQEVIVISDDDDSSVKDTYRRRQVSNDTEIIVLHDSPERPVPPSSSLPPSSQVYDVDDLCGSEDKTDEEFMDAAAFVRASQMKKNHRNSVTSSSTNANGSHSSSPSSSKSLKRKTGDDSSDEEDVVPKRPPPPPRKPVKRRKSSQEDKAAEKAMKIAERERKKREKAEEKAIEKSNKKAWKDANKLVSKKEFTLKDVTVQFSPNLARSALSQKIRSVVVEKLKENLQEYTCKFEPVTDSIVTNAFTNVKTDLNTLGINYIRWKRNVSAVFDEDEREWVPLAVEKHYSRIEGTYLIYITGAELHKFALKGDQNFCPTRQVEALRRALGPKHRIHLMLCGWRNHVLRTEVKARVEKQLVELQIREGIHMEDVGGEEDAAAWIYNLSADLGNKPNKLIERSHLPFCPFGSIKCGNNEKETAEKMLSQLPRLSDNAARAVMRQMNSLNRIMEAYSREEEVGTKNGPKMLKDVQLPTGRTLNNALSERLYNLLWASDPKALVG